MPSLISLLLHYLPQIITLLIELFQKKASLSEDEVKQLDKLVRIQAICEE